MKKAYAMIKDMTGRYVYLMREKIDGPASFFSQDGRIINTVIWSFEHILSNIKKNGGTLLLFRSKDEVDVPNAPYWWKPAAIPDTVPIHVERQRTLEFVNASKLPNNILAELLAQKALFVRFCHHSKIVTETVFRSNLPSRHLTTMNLGLYTSVMFTSLLFFAGHVDKLGYGLLVDKAVLEDVLAKNDLLKQENLEEKFVIANDFTDSRLLEQLSKGKLYTCISKDMKKVFAKVERAPNGWFTAPQQLFGCRTIRDVRRLTSQNVVLCVKVDGIGPRTTELKRNTGLKPLKSATEKDAIVVKMASGNLFFVQRRAPGSRTVCYALSPISPEFTSGSYSHIKEYNSNNIKDYLKYIIKWFDAEIYVYKTMKDACQGILSL